MEILYVKILQQSRQVFTSGSETVKLARSLFNLIVVVVYVLTRSLSRLTNFVSIAWVAICTRYNKSISYIT